MTMTADELRAEYLATRERYRHNPDDYAAIIDDYTRLNHFWKFRTAESLCSAVGAVTSELKRTTCENCFFLMTREQQEIAIEGMMKYVVGFARLPIKGTEAARGQHLKGKGRWARKP